MSARRWREDALPFALLLPSVAYLALLILLPMFQALLLAIQGDDGALTTEHLQRMANDVNFRDAIRNTLVLLVLIVPAQIVLALVMALLVHSRIKGHRWLLYIYAIPLAISDLAAGILWLSVFTQQGYLNTVLQGLGLIKGPIIFLSYENIALVFAAIVVAESWRATALVLVILIAGLQLIPRDYFEAADLFGANRIRRTIHVVLPLLRPSLQSALIIRTIFAFTTFAAVFALAGRSRLRRSSSRSTHGASCLRSSTASWSPCSRSSSRSRSGPRPATRSHVSDSAAATPSRCSSSPRVCSPLRSSRSRSRWRSSGSGSTTAWRASRWCTRRWPCRWSSSSPAGCSSASRTSSRRPRRRSAAPAGRRSCESLFRSRSPASPRRRSSRS